MTATRLAAIVAAARPIALAVSGSWRASGGDDIGLVHATGCALPSRAMPGWRRSLSVAAVGLALLPAAAAAQSAGDEQYEDPFGDQAPQAAPTTAPALAAPATQTQAQATPAPAAPAQPAPAPAPPAPAPG